MLGYVLELVKFLRRKFYEFIIFWDNGLFYVFFNLCLRNFIKFLFIVMYIIRCYSFVVLIIMNDMNNFRYVILLYYI